VKYDVILKKWSLNKEELGEGFSRRHDKKYKDVNTLEESLAYEEKKNLKRSIGSVCLDIRIRP